MRRRGVGGGDIWGTFGALLEELVLRGEFSEEEGAQLQRLAEAHSGPLAQLLKARCTHRSVV